MYDNSFVVSADRRGAQPARRGARARRVRSWRRAGTVKLTLAGQPAAGDAAIAIPRGARLLTPGGHHVAADEPVALSPTSPERDVAVVGVLPRARAQPRPGASPSQKLDRWNPPTRRSPTCSTLREASAGASTWSIEHTDAADRRRAAAGPTPATASCCCARRARSGRADAIQLAVSLVPGVRQVQVRDAWGGLDINQSIFGNFNFIERLFGSERDLGSPYYLTVLVAPTPAAIWDGPDGLRVAVESAIEDLRPISIFPQVEQAERGRRRHRGRVWSSAGCRCRRVARRPSTRRQPAAALKAAAARPRAAVRRRARLRRAGPRRGGRSGR